MKEQFRRTEAVIGTESVLKLQDSGVIVFGIGGVGSFVAEGLARAGVGRITLVDKDVVDITNINRQLPALHSTIGKSKAGTMAERIKDINPDCIVEAGECFFMPDTADEFDFTQYDYVVDAVDTVTAKLLLAEKCAEVNIPLISIMGTGNKLEATMLEVADIFDTTICPLARIMRKELKARGIKNLKVVYSKEEPKPSSVVDENGKPIEWECVDMPSWIPEITEADEGAILRVVNGVPTWVAVTDAQNTTF
jgi:tRNA A37 threonylcarbamoyladenosine dehydratase